ncbi:snRNA-activating protein complex subunit 3 [Trinorchestia longiramus]|nr:snRNA-activating protein complex subunit 3 [Trinorchestia longiramus]
MTELTQLSELASASVVGWQEACRSFFSEHASSLDDDLSCDAGSTKPSLDDLCSLEQMEQDCGIDLLTVPNELPANDRLDDGGPASERMPPNWFQGAFCDGVIPEGGGDRLLTLYHQTAELLRRNSVGDYATLRYRTLKYFSTFRLPLEINGAPMESDFLDDVVISVRIQRPFFKKIHFKKPCNRFPAHSQELLLRGCQHLTSLRDAIECVNDIAVNKNLAATPHLKQVAFCSRAKEECPSGMFYINGTFYVDMRLEGCKDYSAHIIKWAKRFSEIGEMKTARMEETRFLDLRLRLGYPCLYLHQGYCEHLITFTDVRMQEKTDVEEVTRYPLTRGHATKISVRCITCHHSLAQWVVLGYKMLSEPLAHLCDACLHLFCYDDHGKPKADFKLYVYYDEGSMQLEKLRQLEAEQRGETSSALRQEDDDEDLDGEACSPGATSSSSLTENDDS